MKKALLTLPILALLASCGGTPASSSTPSAYTLDLEVISPAGAPAVALYRSIKSDKLEINADPSLVVGKLDANSGKDIVIAPTNAGLSAIVKKGAPYKIAATVTFGNFYLASTGLDVNGKLDDDDYVVAFQQNNVPDKILKHCYPTLSNIHYVDAATNAAQALISGKNISDNNHPVDYVLMAEPALTNALSKNQNAKEYTNLQEVFKTVSEGKEITQASIFVANSAPREKVNAFLAEIKDSVETFLASPAAIESYVAGLSDETLLAKFTSPIAVIESMTQKGNRMGLGYHAAYANKAAVGNFAALFGLTELNEEVFYQ